MPSRAYTSFLPGIELYSVRFDGKLVSMPSRAYTSFLQVVSEILSKDPCGVNALSGLYLISTIDELKKDRAR